MEPLRAGELIVSPAAVSYVDALSGEDHVTRLASEEIVRVEDAMMFRRRTEKHGGVWMAYSIVCLVLCVVPFVVSGLLQTNIEDAKKN